MITVTNRLENISFFPSPNKWLLGDEWHENAPGRIVWKCRQISSSCVTLVRAWKIVTYFLLGDKATFFRGKLFHVSLIGSLAAKSKRPICKMQMPAGRHVWLVERFVFFCLRNLTRLSVWFATGNVGNEPTPQPRYHAPVHLWLLYSSLSSEGASHYNDYYSRVGVYERVRFRPWALISLRLIPVLIHHATPDVTPGSLYPATSTDPPDPFFYPIDPNYNA